MKKEIALALIIAIFMLPVNSVAQNSSYYPFWDYSIDWDVSIASDFTMWYTEGGYCHVVNDSIMSFSVNSIDNEVSGTLEIGNVTVATNDTMVALDLTLGIWPSWLTGLFVEIGQEKIDSLNETAYAAAERVSGNWMNGTMSSRYEDIVVNQETYSCIVFDYEQDPPGTQVTHLAYSTATGLLVEADTSVTFGSTFRLVFSLREVRTPPPVDFTVNPLLMLAWYGIIGGGVLAVIVLVYIVLNKRQ
ncbi:MAG: hypothetical protein ACFFE2_07715 [Candidatus Thorarchaeota archaeon]